MQVIGNYVGVPFYKNVKQIMSVKSKLCWWSYYIIIDIKLCWWSRHRGLHASRAILLSKMYCIYIIQLSVMFSCRSSIVFTISNLLGVTCMLGTETFYVISISIMDIPVIGDNKSALSVLIVWDNCGCGWMGRTERHVGTNNSEGAWL